MKLSKKIAITTALAAVVAIGNIAFSKSASALTKESRCAPKMTQPIATTDTTASAVFQIAENCPTQTVSLSVYLKPVDTYPLSNQRNHSYATKSYGSGKHTIKTAMPAKGCYYQVDLFMGGPNVVPTKPTYLDVLLGWKQGGNRDCLADPVDVCPNLAGMQRTVPTGYTRVGNKCVIIPTDVCPNLEGMQKKVPAGYKKDANGNCVLIPVDVCPNLEGMQESVPEGYTKDASGKCLMDPKGPEDVCPNIDKMQEEVPAGYTSDENGNCVIVPEDEPEQPQVQGKGTPEVLPKTGAGSIVAVFGATSGLGYAASRLKNHFSRKV